MVTFQALISGLVILCLSFYLSRYSKEISVFLNIELISIPSIEELFRSIREAIESAEEFRVVFAAIINITTRQLFQDTHLILGVIEKLFSEIQSLNTSFKKESKPYPKKLKKKNNHYLLKFIIKYLPEEYAANAIDNHYRWCKHYKSRRIAIARLLIIFLPQVIWSELVCKLKKYQKQQNK